ncbi:hypothetical protein Tco_0001829 [Tanacetum coccineum]
MAMIEDDWELEPKEVSFLGRRLNLPDRPKEVENEITNGNSRAGIFKEKKKNSSLQTLETPSGLILTASPGRKPYLLEDKQISSVGVFDEVFLALGWLLEEIHVTWAHLEKKRTRLRTYTKSHDDFCKQWLETSIKRRRRDQSSDGVRNIATASGRG